VGWRWTCWTSARVGRTTREIAAAYTDLVASGRELGVAMPVMASFDADVRAFAGLTPR
jgi:hypothetical protein